MADFERLGEEVTREEPTRIYLGKGKQLFNPSGSRTATPPTASYLGTGPKTSERTGKAAAEESFPDVPDIAPPKKKKEKRRGPSAMEKLLEASPEEMRKRREARLKRLEESSERAKRVAGREYERAIHRAERHPPSIAELKSSSEALRQAVRRGQVKKIARVAAPWSRDTESAFTADHGRYAYTDKYKPTVRERAGLARE